MQDLFQLLVLPLWAWIAVKVVEQGRKIAELEQRITSQENHCRDRLVWMRSMEETLSQVASDTLIIRTKLGEPPHG